MLKLQLSFRSWRHLFIYITIAIIVYTEVITYSILPFQWRTPISNCQYPKCSKILLVADPQIIGSQIGGHDFLNFVAKWDSDRYIRRTFFQAFNFLQPEVVIFLGDLMDEGHISSNEEFFNDLKRFLSIFHFSTLLSDVPKIFLPGDNDIGGMEDIMLPKIVDRFNKIFNQSDEPFFLKDIEFYKVNFLTFKIQEPNYIDQSNNDRTIRVAMSHVPLLHYHSLFLNSVVRKIRPHIIFSGHDHFSSYSITSESDIWNKKYIEKVPSDTFGNTYSIKTGFIHEITVPTCSYRMGFKNMGYGAAFIDSENKLLHYNVLWLPRRFPQLSIYLGIVLVLLLYFFGSIFKYSLRRLRRLSRICSKHNHLLCGKHRRFFDKPSYSF